MDNPETSNIKQIFPVRCKINIRANRRGEIPLRNHSMMLGAIYNLFAQADPVFSYKHHKNTNVRPWSFSLLKFNSNPEPAEKDGFSEIKKDMSGFFYIKTIDSDTYRVLMKFSSQGSNFIVGRIPFTVESIDVTRGGLNRIPEDINIIRIRLDSPTFFYNSSENKLQEFNGENFLIHQCEKFKQLGIMNIEPKQLFPYLWIIKKKTFESWGEITDFAGEQKVISLKGEVGKLVFKIVGNPTIRQLLGKILYLSEYTGIGTRTSMGFGHNTLLSMESNL